jgi:serine/threonine-protein kinase HipA
MARPSRSRSLHIWANGRHVGEWAIPSRRGSELRYDPRWVTSREGRPLSLSLPFNIDGQPQRGDHVEFFFDNLLPDNDAIRRRIRERFHTTSSDAFDLLAAIGRDCVGAVQLLPEDTKPEINTTISATPLDDSAIEQLLRATVSGNPFRAEGDDEFRISIAGAHEKTALTRHNGRWCMPHGSTPTTHIVKLPLGQVGPRQMDLRTSVENEWLCGQILHHFAVPVAKSEIHAFGATRVLIVERFDRVLHSSGSYWLRLPQEDFCQATGRPASRKYESDGGPGLVEIARILQGSEARDQDLETLFTAQLLFWMLAAIDGHAKNFSVRLLAGGRYQLTPIYDVLSAWPIVGTRHDQMHIKKLKLAMALHGRNRHYHVVDIESRHFIETARACGFNGMETVIRAVIERSRSLADAIQLPSGFPGELFERVMTEFAKSAEVLARGLRDR